MDEIIVKYRSLLQLLEKEYDAIGTALGGELLQKYRQILKEEMEQVQNNMHLFYKYY